MSVIPLLSQLRESRPHRGTWLSVGSPVIAELAAGSGFDWLLLDLEHGCGTESDLLPQLQAIGSASTTTAAIVRVGAPYPDLVMRVLDRGAHGIMAPRVSSAAEAEAVVQAAHYPPRGKRGFSRSVRAYDYGVNPPAAPDTLPKPLLVAQIETIEGVRNAREIAAVDGVDVLFVGPSDLKFDLRARQAEATSSYDECLRLVADAAAANRKQCGILVRRPEDIASVRSLGYTFIAVGSDMGLLLEGYANLNRLTVMS